MLWNIWQQGKQLENFIRLIHDLRFYLDLNLNLKAIITLIERNVVLIITLYFYNSLK